MGEKVEYRSEHFITNQFMDDTKIRQDRLVLDVIVKMVRNIPLDKLKELFNVEVITEGYCMKQCKNSSNYDDFKYWGDKINELKNKDAFQITAKIEL